MTKHTQHKRKLKRGFLKFLAVIRKITIALFGIFFMLGACSIESENLTFPIVCLVVGAVCFGVCYYVDQILWLNDYEEESPFIH